MTTLQRLRPLLEPAIAAAALTLWLASNAPNYVSYVPMRSDYGSTNPYHVAIAVALAFSIAVVRVLPRFAVGILAVTFVVQLVAWPTRFSNDNWSAYLMLLPVVAGLSLYGSRKLRIVAIVLGLPAAALVAAFLNVPALSSTGMWGLINGKPAQTPDVATGFAIFTTLFVALFSFVWYLGYLRRSRADRVDSLEQFDGGASQRATSIGNASSLAALTPREREVYFLIAEGLTTGEIATATHIEESTVKSHTSSVLSKLGLTSRTAIVAHAYRNGFLVPAPVD